MKRLIFLCLITVTITGAYGQKSWSGPLDTVKISENCELFIPQLCDTYDFWVLSTNCEVENFHLDVLDKWGTHVFSSDTLVKNGFVLARTHKNKNGGKHLYRMPDGVYYWLINIKI